MSVINTNVLALQSQNNLQKSQSALGSAIERLSSGMRINSAKDDAAGQAIANRFTANIKGLTQAGRNANDGISVAQTTEGALNEINNNLQRIRELSVQAANGSNSSSDLKSIQDEIGQRLAEIDRISEQTQFNGVKVLASDNDLRVQVGAHDQETINIGLKQINSKSLGLSGFNVNGPVKATAGDLVGEFGATGTHNYKVDTSDYKVDISSGKVTDGDGKAQYISIEDGSFTEEATVSNTISTVYKTSAEKNDQAIAIAAAAKGGKAGDTFSAEGFNFTIKNVDEFGNGVFSAKVDGVTVDFTISDETADGNAAKVAVSTDLYTSKSHGGLTTKGTESNRAATVVDLDLAGASKTGSTLSLNGVKYKVDADGEVQNEDGKVMYLSTTSSGNKTLITEEAAEKQKSTLDPLKTLDNALSKVDSLRGELGAIQNRFESTITNLSNTVANLSAARSRIEDADYAVEVSNMTRAQILQQAGTSVLAQANQVPQSVLSLLR